MHIPSAAAAAALLASFGMVSASILLPANMPDGDYIVNNAGLRLLNGTSAPRFTLVHVPADAATTQEEQYKYGYDDEEYDDDDDDDEHDSSSIGAEEDAGTTLSSWGRKNKHVTCHNFKVGTLEQVNFAVQGFAREWDGRSVQGSAAVSVRGTVAIYICNLHRNKKKRFVTVNTADVWTAMREINEKCDREFAGVRKFKKISTSYGRTNAGLAIC